MTTVGKKTVDGPLQDFDNDSYDEVVEVPEADKKPSNTEIDLVKAEPKELLIYFANRFKETQ